ncbi:hypothetical protein [Streptomyces sp. AD55]|uniref:hypothetical protein n=1 Tax=Streptomyces sp. AD55 TaxID=3242895 RepID=UPI003526D6B6
MENRIEHPAPPSVGTSQADEALRRARSADRDIHRAIARRTGLLFLRGLTDLTRRLPSPAGPALRVTVTVIGTGEELGSVDIDSTNLGDLGSFATRRAATFQPNSNPTPVGKPALHLVGGAR